jgi:glutamate transport system permease protein
MSPANRQGSGIFDSLGPKARRRSLIGNVFTLLVVAGLVFAGGNELHRKGQLAGQKWSTFTDWTTWRFLLKGLRSSIEAGGGAAILAFVFGLLLALARMSRRPLLRIAARIYVEIFRSIPVLLLIYMTLFGLPHYGVNLSLYWKLVGPLTLAATAIVCEVFRSGILSVERGQGEAALALGLRHSQAMYRVVLPQAIRSVIPALVSQFVSILKDTSLGFVVSYNELLFTGQIFTSYSRLLIQTYLVIAAMYLVLNGILSKIARVLDARGNRQGALLAGARLSTDESVAVNTGGLP